MKKVIMKGYKNQSFYTYHYEIDNPRGIIIIAHGLAESAERYDYFANQLNKINLNVYTIDHISHGPNTTKDSLGHWEKGDFNGCLANINTLTLQLKQKYPNLKFILFGHSMGSFMVQKYQLLYPKMFDALILCGCAKADALFKLGNVASHFFGAFTKPTKRLEVIDNMSFKSFNKKFKPVKTPNDWLSKNEKENKWYMETEHIGFIGTASFYKEFYSNVSKIPNKKFDHLYEKDYPILLIGGKDDMVSNRGKKLINLAKYYQKQSDRVAYKLYENDRHEILNEPDRDVIIKDIIMWVEKNIYER